MPEDNSEMYLLFYKFVLPWCDFTGIKDPVSVWKL